MNRVTLKSNAIKIGLISIASVAFIGLIYAMFNDGSSKSYTNSEPENTNTQTLGVMETKKNLDTPSETQKSSQVEPSTTQSQQTTTHSAGLSSYLPPTSNQAPTCNVQLKASYDSKKAADLAYENTKHTSYNPPAPRDSSDWGNLMDAENRRHDTAVEVIESDYQTKLVSINCL